MKRSEKLYKVLNQVVDVFEAKLEAIKKEIGAFDKVKEVEVGFSGWMNHYVQISITPESAWSDVMRLEVYADKHTFHTSSGGWNDESKALEEFAIISNQLLNWVKNFDASVLNELEALNRKISKLHRLIEKAKRLEKIREELQDKRKLTDEEIKTIMRTIREDGKEYTIFIKTRTGLSAEKVTFYRNRYRLTDFVVTKKELEDILKRAYIHK